MAELIGLGTVLARHNGTTFQDVGQVVSVTPPGATLDDIETTDLGNTDGVKSFVPGLVDPGELQFTVRFDPEDTGHQALQDDAYSRATRQWKVTFPSGETLTMSGYVKGFEIQEIQPGELIEAQVTIKVTGKPTFATA